MNLKKRDIDGCYECNSALYPKYKKKNKIFPTYCSKCKKINRSVVKNCPICKSSKYEMWGESVRNFYSVKCKSCQIVYVKNPLSSFAQNLFYKNYHTTVHQKEKKKNKQRSKMYKLELNFIKKGVNNYERIKNVLDVGCGGGYLLDLLKIDGKKTFGTEIGIDSFNVARKKHKMYFGNFDRKLIIKKKFDLIIFRGVIEHVEDPIGYIKKAQKLLKKNGHVFITATPNLDCIAAKLFKERWSLHRPESHILHLSEEHVDKIFKTKSFIKVASKSFYLDTPYENFERDLISILNEIKRKKKKIKSKNISPAFFESMMSVIYKKVL